MLSIIDLRHCFSPPAHKLSVAALAGNWVTRTSLSARAALKNKKQKKNKRSLGAGEIFGVVVFSFPPSLFPSVSRGLGRKGRGPPLGRTHFSSTQFFNTPTHRLSPPPLRT